MSDTIFGYKVASPEQQRRTALMIVIAIPLVILMVIGGIYAGTSLQQSGREQAIATINDFQTKCRYVVRNISRRVSYYDHTGYIDCRKAHAIARQNDNPLGSVQQSSVATVTFTSKDGLSYSAYVDLAGSEFSVGQAIEILYLVDNPANVQLFTSAPLGFGKKSLISAVSPEQGNSKELAVAPTKPKRNIWIGFLVVCFTGLLLIWLAKKTIVGFYRMLSGEKNSRKPKVIAPRGAAREISENRIARVTRRQPQPSISRRPV